MARLKVLALVAALVVATGCQVERKWTVYPDGSGKLVESMQMDQQQAEMLKNMSGGGGGGEAKGAAQKMKGTVEGKIEFLHVSYFEDLNKVSDPATTCEWKKRDDGGFDLKMTIDTEKMKKGAMQGMKGMPGMPGMPGKEGKEGKEGEGEGPDMGGMGEAMAQQMKFTVTIVMPGEVTSTSVGTKAGRTVKVPVETGDAAAEKDKTLVIAVSCAAPDEKKLEGEIKRFQKELEGAKKGGEGEEKEGKEGKDEKKEK